MMPYYLFSYHYIYVYIFSIMRVEKREWESNSHKSRFLSISIPLRQEGRKYYLHTYITNISPGLQ